MPPYQETAQFRFPSGTRFLGARDYLGSTLLFFLTTQESKSEEWNLLLLGTSYGIPEYEVELLASIPVHAHDEMRFLFRVKL